MSGVMRRLAGRYRGHDGDTGAVASFVAVLLAGGVLLGMAALVGQLYAERQELQNGADASAVSLALSCAKAGCDPVAAQKLADSNARDAATTIDTICGKGAGLADCAPPEPGLTGCKGTRPANNYVEVRTSTATSDGKTVLPPTFAQSIVGGGYKGTTVGACARARWGTPKRLPKVFSLGISLCAYNKATKSGTELVPPEDFEAGWPEVEHEKKIYNWWPGGPCEDSPFGKGDLAWFDAPGLGCFRKISSGVEVEGTSGNSLITLVNSLVCRVASGIELILGKFLTEHRKPIQLAIYDPDKSTRFNRYHIVGFATFVPTGYAMGALAVPGNGGFCNLPLLGLLDSCIMGYFTTGTTIGGVGDGGTDLGVKAVELDG